MVRLCNFRLVALAAFASLAASLAPAAAQGWPNKPIHIVIPFPAGGSVDQLGRVFAAKLQDQLKVPVVVESRSGAGGNIAGAVVAKSAPDGYTYVMHTNGLSVAPAIYRTLPYDPVADLARVAELVTTSQVVVVANSLPVKTFQEFVAYAKANPGKMNYGATGIGTASQLAMEMLKAATKTEIQVVPFTGDAPLFTALMGGEVQCALVPTTAAKAHIDGGDIRAIAVTTATRVPTMPSVPTVVEQGLPDFSVTGWIGLFAPAGTPRDIVDRMARESLAAISSPALKEPLANLSLDAASMGPDEFDRLYKDEVASFKKIVKDANIPTQE